VPDHLSYYIKIAYIIVWTKIIDANSTPLFNASAATTNGAIGVPKGEIVALSDLYSHREIGRRLDIPHSTVSAFLNRYADRENYDNLHHTGRPRKTTSSDDHYLVRSAESNTSQPLAQLRLDTNLDVSEQTNRRRLREVGIWKHKAVNRPLLTPKQIAERLKWARDHQNWSVEHWQRVIWSDETMVRNRNDPRPKLVFRRRNKLEKYDPKNVQPKSNYGGASQMVWACFVGDKLGPIVFMDSSITKEVYIEMLADTLLPFVDVLHADGQADVVFQQDNATPHSSPVTRKWLEDEAKKHGFSIMQWPSNSPDLNPIEHLWAHVKRELHRQYPDTWHLKGSPDVIRRILKERIHEIWWNIGSTVLKSLIESMPHRVHAVLDAGGNVMGY
jgi:transposase